MVFTSEFSSIKGLRFEKFELYNPVTVAVIVAKGSYSVTGKTVNT